MAHLYRAVRAGAAVRFAVWAGFAVLICCERAAPGGVIQRQQSQALDLVRWPVPGANAGQPTPTRYKP